MAESDICFDEIELSDTDVMMGKFIISPLHISTQFSVSAEPPGKQSTKQNKKDKLIMLHNTVQTQRQINRKPGAMPPVSVVGALRLFWIQSDEIIGVWSCHARRKQWSATVLQL